jgi:predicted Zn finger-like uncharacterized protein
MDVSCPRCKTEYEFDDARVPDGGVTVKCTNCSYVFRVKRSESPSGEVPKPPPTQPDPLLPPASSSGVAREWKVRQPSGNVFNFKELTTLQKWIVERKVARQDEISLSGETWKRLGDIPELASFFIVVDEAMRAAKLEAAKESGGPPPSAPQPLPQVSSPAVPARVEPEAAAPKAARDSGQFPISRIPQELEDRQATDETLREPAFAHRPPGNEGLPPAVKKVLETLKEPTFSAPAVSPSKPVPLHEVELKPRASAPRPAPRPSAPRAPPPPPPPRQMSAPVDNDWEAPVVRRSSGGGWFFFLLVAALVGGGIGYYFAIYLPDQRHAADERAAEEARLAEEKAAADAEAAAKLAAEEKARKEKEAAAALAAAQVKDAGAAVAVEPVKPAPAVDAGAVAEKPVAPPPKRDFEWYVAQGDRLRDKEKPDKALEMYGQAADLEPERVEPAAGRGLALLDMGKALQAEAAFQEALKLNGRYAPAIMGLAETYRAMKKNEKAVEWYQKYLDVLPNGPEANVAKINIERLSPKKEEPAPE